MICSCFHQQHPNSRKVLNLTVCLHLLPYFVNKSRVEFFNQNFKQPALTSDLYPNYVYFIAIHAAAKIRAVSFFEQADLGLHCSYKPVSQKF